MLFTDLVGSTALLARLSPAEGDVLISRHFAGLRGALAVHRGREVKTLGDGFMAVFDSANDALACAVTMQQAVARQNRDHSEHELKIRVGLSAGEVSESDGDFHGMPVVEAARLCAAASADQILAADVVGALVGGNGMHRVEPVAALELKGIPDPVRTSEVRWDAEEGFALRVALAEDSALMREGVAKLLESEAIEVVLEASDADELLSGLSAARPHVVILDVRMPPTHTTEGLDAAERIKAEHPEMGVLVLSAALQVAAAERLLSRCTDGIGYLLKDLVGDATELISAVRTVASGGSAIAPEVVARLATVK